MRALECAFFLMQTRRTRDGQRSAVRRAGHAGGHAGELSMRAIDG